MNPQVKAYLAKIGSKGGSKSKRVLTPEQARDMVKAKKRYDAREACSERGSERRRQ